MQAIPEPNTERGLPSSAAASAAAGTRAVAAPTCATTNAPTRTRVFGTADFAHTTYKECHLTRAQFEAYKKRFLGKPVPPQTVNDEHLVALGYDLPEPWIQRCIEQDLPNFS